MNFIKPKLKALKKAYCFKNVSTNDNNVTQIMKVYIYSPIHFFNNNPCTLSMYLIICVKI